MRRRIFATLLSLCLVLGLLPTAAFAQDTSNYVTQEDSITGLADGEQAFPEMVAESGESGGEEQQPEFEDPVSEPQVEQLWVNGENILEATDYTVQCGSGKAVYDPADNTLTLENATITEAHYNNGNIEFTGDLTIVLIGENTITGDSNFYGIGTSYGSLTIRGEDPSAKLTIKGCFFGIHLEGNLNISNSTLDITGTSGGIRSYSDISISGSTVTAYSEIGSFCGIATDGSLTIDSTSTVTAVSENEASFGASATEGIIIDGNIYSCSGPEMVIENGDPKEGLRTFGVVVNGVDVLTAADYTVSCGGGKAVYDPADNTLTLNNAEISSGYAYYSYSCGIYSDEDLTIVLEGNSTIQSNSADALTFGVYGQGKLTIEGEGRLTIASSYRGICSNYLEYDKDAVSVEIDDCQLDITVTGGETDTDNDYLYQYYCGIYSNCGVSVQDGDVDIAVTSPKGGYGILSDRDSDSSQIAIKNSSVQITTDGNYCSGLSAKSVEISGDTTNITSAGEIYCPNGLRITGTPMISVTSEEGSLGIYCPYGDITINGLLYSCTGNNIQITNGDVIYGLRENCVWVDGEKLNNQNTTISCGDGTAVYDPEANTLTLDNATITTAHEFFPWNDDLGYAYIYVDYYEENPMTIILRGENTIASSSENNIGVFANHLIIKAEDPDAALTISEPLSIIDCVSIVVESGTISANALFDNMTVRGGSVIAEGYGLDGWNSITIEGGTVAASGPEEYAGIRGSKVTISGGTVTTSGEDCGLYALDMTVNGSPTITVEASGPNANGIYARDGLAVSGSPTITATTSGEVGNAIYTNGDVTISGSPTITATAGAGQAAIGAGGITINDLPYVCTGSAAHIAAGQVAYGLRQEGAPVPDPDPDRPSHDRDDDDDRDPAATTESERNPDGSITTTVTRPDGTTVETTRNTDGSKEVVETKKDGTVVTTATDKSGNETKTTENPDGTSVVSVTRTDGSTSTTTVDKDGLSVTVAALSEDAVARGQTGAVSLPMPGAIAAGDLENAPAVTLDLPGDTSVRVEIPVENMTAGTVAVLVTADGSSEIVKTSVATESGVVLTLSGGETVKLVDNTKTFADVAGSFWGAEAVTFVTSRELFQGTGAATFDPNAPMDRAMIVTVLARLDGVDTTTGGAWYEAGAQWAMSNGISDGSGLDQNLTREQLAVMLYRYAQYKGYDVSAGEDANILSYADAFDVSEYAIPAMQWACGAGVISGKDGALDPAGSATRAEVAAMLMRFCQFVL